MLRSGLSRVSETCADSCFCVSEWGLRLTMHLEAAGPSRCYERCLVSVGILTEGRSMVHDSRVARDTASLQVRM